MNNVPRPQHYRAGRITDRQNHRCEVTLYTHATTGGVSNEVN